MRNYNQSNDVSSLKGSKLLLVTSIMAIIAGIILVIAAILLPIVIIQQSQDISKALFGIILFMVTAFLGLAIGVIGFLTWKKPQHYKLQISLGILFIVQRLFYEFFRVVVMKKETTLMMLLMSIVIIPMLYIWGALRNRKTFKNWEYKATYLNGSVGSASHSMPSNPSVSPMPSVQPNPAIFHLKDSDNDRREAKVNSGFQSLNPDYRPNLENFVFPSTISNVNVNENRLNADEIVMRDTNVFKEQSASLVNVNAQNSHLNTTNPQTEAVLNSVHSPSNVNMEADKSNEDLNRGMEKFTQEYERPSEMDKRIDDAGFSGAENRRYAIPSIGEIPAINIAEQSNDKNQGEEHNAFTLNQAESKVNQGFVPLNPFVPRNEEIAVPKAEPQSNAGMNLQMPKFEGNVEEIIKPNASVFDLNRPSLKTVVEEIPRNSLNIQMADEESPKSLNIQRMDEEIPQNRSGVKILDDELTQNRGMGLSALNEDLHRETLAESKSFNPFAHRQVEEANTVSSQLDHTLNSSAELNSQMSDILQDTKHIDFDKLSIQADFNSGANLEMQASPTMPSEVLEMKKTDSLKSENEEEVKELDPISARIAQMNKSIDESIAQLQMERQASVQTQEFRGLNNVIINPKNDFQKLNIENNFRNDLSLNSESTKLNPSLNEFDFNKPSDLSKFHEDYSENVRVNIVMPNHKPEVHGSEFSNDDFNYDLSSKDYTMKDFGTSYSEPESVIKYNRKSENLPINHDLDSSSIHTELQNSLDEYLKSQSNS